MKGEFQAKDPQMQKYYHLTKHLLDFFEEHELFHMFQEDNDRIDVLSRLTSSKRQGLHRTCIQETLAAPSIDSWMNVIWKYLVNDQLPSDNSEARKVKLKLAYYAIFDEEIF